MQVLPLPPFALPALARATALRRTHDDWSVPTGFRFLAPAVRARLNRVQVRA